MHLKTSGKERRKFFNASIDPKINIGVKSYYVWAIPPGEERSEDLQFKVVRENSKWKVLAFKAWEEEGWFKALIEQE